MATETASANRGGAFTSAHKCSGCGKAFWANPAWSSGTSVKCPHCSRIN